MTKNIVVCCDGTNNEVAGDQTNVLRLFRMLVRNEQQRVFYDAGVGTSADPTVQWWPQRLVHKRIDGAIGLSVRDNVLNAYRFLITHYMEGDRIYLFGFSRGAYTVRALAGMIFRCGLIYEDFDNITQYAWSIYSDEDRLKDKKRIFGGTARIKKVFGRRVPIHFVGVWDTVSTFGWIWDLLTLPNTDTNKDIKHFRHALAIDERRSCYEPIPFWRGEAQDSMEVWFPGVHSDIGGGYPEAEAGLSKAPLEWMLNEAVGYHLEVNKEEVKEQLHRIEKYEPQAAFGTMHDESRRLLWRLQGWFPKRSYLRQKGHNTWHWPNRAKRRTIPAGALIHRTAIDRLENNDIEYAFELPQDYAVIGITSCKQLEKVIHGVDTT